jgi:general secretion pathway protein D
LGSIPWLGRLFRYDKTTKTKRTLMVFIRPTIISSPAMGRSISQSKYTYLRGQQNQLANMKSLEVKPELAEFPEPPVPSEEEQNNPDSENNPDLLFDDKSQ